MIFKLEIQLGNAAMQDGADIMLALDTLALQIGSTDISNGPSGGIRDVNGNRVGTFWIEDDDPADITVTLTRPEAEAACELIDLGATYQTDYMDDYSAEADRDTVSESVTIGRQAAGKIAGALGGTK